MKKTGIVMDEVLLESWIEKNAWMLQEVRE